MGLLSINHQQKIGEIYNKMELITGFFIGLLFGFIAGFIFTFIIIFLMINVLERGIG